MEDGNSPPQPSTLSLAHENMPENVVNSEDQIMVVRGRSSGYCSICCRPTNTSHLIGRCHERGTLPPGGRSLGYHHGIKYSPQIGGWDIQQPSRREFLCFKAYTLKTPTRDPSFIICYDCMLILPRFFRSRADKVHRQGRDDIYNPDILYQHLRRQFLRWSDDQESAERLLWLHNGFIDENVKWEKHHTGRWITQPEYKWLEREASEPIASLSNWVLSNLKPLTPLAMQKVSFLSTNNHTISRLSQSSAICNFPAEIIMIIGNYLNLSSIFSMRETCWHFSQCIELNQWFWYTRFIRYELFGFMFTHESQDVIADIEAKAVKRGLLPNKMDWMSLLKQMSAFSSFAGGGCLDSAPPTFRNRRRIWKILEMMETDIADVPVARHM